MKYVTLNLYGYYAGILLFALSVSPSVAYASYTAYGQEFSTAEELATYLREYNRVYNELHDTDTRTTTESTGTRTNTQTRSSARGGASVITDKAQDIDMYSARLIGRVTTSHTTAVRVWFEYGARALTERTADEVLYDDRSVRHFDRKLRDLSHNTTYYYRAVAVNDAGVITYGNVRTFKTAVDPRKDTAAVRIRTGSATRVDEHYATLRASIDFRKSAYARVWFEYGDESDDLYKKTPVTVVTPRSGKAYEHTISHLDETTAYYFRVVGEDPNGARSYGKITKFTTRKDVANEPPKVTANRAHSMTLHEAVVSGTIDMNDSRNGIAFLVYGEDKEKVSSVGTDYTRVSRIREDGDDLQKVLLDDDLDRFDTYEETLVFLDLDTTYYYAFGVEYENHADDEVLLMSRTSSFKTKGK